MSTPSQINANQANAQHSTGPRTEEGRASVGQNNFRHGFTGSFRVLAAESQKDFDTLVAKLCFEHQPQTPFEVTLVERMAQHYWLTERALNLQNTCFEPGNPDAPLEKKLALYLRYQTTHDRAFHKAGDELRKLRNEKRKHEIGFESQKQKEAQLEAAGQRREAQEKRREAAEHRASELHQARVWLTEAIARRHETETTIARVLKMPREYQEAQEKATQKAA